MQIFFRGLNSCRMFCSVAQEGTTLKFRYKVRPRIISCVTVLQDIFECSYFQAYEILRKNPVLRELDINRIEDAAKVLKDLQIRSEEIRKCPRVLAILPITIEHHLRLLKESGFPKVSAQSIVTYRSLTNKRISLLKAHGLLPADANVSRNFLNTLEAPKNVFQSVESIIDINSDKNNISILRDTILKCYLQWRLNSSREDIEYIFKTYVRMFHKSLQLIRKTLSFLLNELHFTKEQIVRNGYLIQAHPDHLRKIVETAPYLAGKPIQDVLRACPLMAAASYENFIEILNVLRSVGISEKSIVRNQGIFHLSGRLVRERLPSLDPKVMSPEMKAFMVDEKFLQVLLNYENFNQRVTFLSNQRQSSSLPHMPSLSLLLGSEEAFERFVKGVGGQVKGFDTVNYLVNHLRRSEGAYLNVTPMDIRAQLRKNPNWRNVPLSEVRTCFEMLCQKGYKPKEILSALPILLYPSNMVEDHLNHLSSQPEILECFQLDGILGSDLQGKGCKNSDDNVSKCKSIINNNQTALIHKYALPLCLYFLEKDYHFSGDGIWFRG